jgi:transcriptional regulator with XRE-family HTH domain
VTAPDWRALADAVRDRRDELGLRQADVGRHGGPSTGTVRNIESAARTGYSGRTLRQIERALQWPSGHVDRVLAGDAVDDEKSIIQILDATLAVDGEDGSTHIPRGTADDDAHALRVGRLVLALWRDQDADRAGWSRARKADVA